jgi:hypothetical protein
VDEVDAAPWYPNNLRPQHHVDVEAVVDVVVVVVVNELLKARQRLP